MRGKLVKAIRKAIYGTQSIKGKRRYAKDETGCIYNVGLRQSYKALKKSVMSHKSKGVDLK